MSESFAFGEPAVPQNGSLMVVPFTAPAGARLFAEKEAVVSPPAARFADPVLAVATSAPALAKRSTTRASSSNRTSCGACAADSLRQRDLGLALDLDLTGVGVVDDVCEVVDREHELAVEEHRVPAGHGRAVVVGAAGSSQVTVRSRSR